MRPSNAYLAAALALAAAPLGDSAERAPLSQQIDRIVQKKLDERKLPASPPAEDAVFLRRVYLDLIGRIPTVEQAKAFLDSTDPDRRTKLIDELLARPEYGVYFAYRWRERIVDRSDDLRLTRAFNSQKFAEWLAAEFNQSRGWDQIVTEMLTAEGEVKAKPAGVFLMANRVNNFPRPEDITATTGRLFLGLHLRCAQCHNHPYVDEWKQDDFWGMAAFFGQIRDRAINFASGDENRNPSFSEVPNPDAKAEKQYTGRMRSVGQIPPQAGPKIAIPLGSNPDDIKRVVSAKFFLGETPELPETGPYRPALAKWLTSKSNPYFARAAMNRLWAHFFDRGLVNPIDDMTPLAEPSHPELLSLLETEFKNADFDFKVMIRALCQTDAYQRSSKSVPGNADDREMLSHMPVRVFNPDQLVDSHATAFGRPTPVVHTHRDSVTAMFCTQDPDEPAANLSHGIPQFLQMMNSLVGTNFVLPKQMAGKKKEEAVEILYLAALSRRPRAEELRRMTEYIDRRILAKNGSLHLGLTEVYWVLINSAEFMVNR